MRDLLRTAHQVQAFLDRQGWRSPIMGGLVGRSFFERRENPRRTLETA